MSKLLIKAFSECCGGISGINLKLSGDPAGYQFGLIGKYNLQSDLETGRHYWVKENGNYAIWYTEHNVVLLFLAITPDFWSFFNKINQFFDNII